MQNTGSFNPKGIQSFIYIPCPYHAGPYAPDRASFPMAFRDVKEWKSVSSTFSQDDQSKQADKTREGKQSHAVCSGAFQNHHSRAQA
jgi:hypothetical protein